MSRDFPPPWTRKDACPNQVILQPSIGEVAIVEGSKIRHGAPWSGASRMRDFSREEIPSFQPKISDIPWIWCGQGFVK
jgi:hypothetical protein